MAERSPARSAEPRTVARILVTGATSAASREILSRLSNTGVAARALTGEPERMAALNLTGVEIVEGDLNDRDAYEPALEGIEKVFLVSPLSPRLPRLESEVVEAAEEAGIKRIVKMSIATANAASPVRVLRWHGEVERRIEEADLGFTFIRPAWYMQGVIDRAEGILEHRTLRAPMKSGRLAPVDARDVAVMAFRALTERGHDGMTYEATGPEALDFAGMAEILSSVTGRRIEYVDTPLEDERERLRGTDLPADAVDAMLELYAHWAEQREVRVTDAVARVIRRGPMSFERFVREHLDVFV